jgi:predicted transcriptional regulator
MKSLHVRFDDDLLARLDASEEVRQRGRSEVLQRATAEYLGRCCQASEAIAEQYRKAYEHGSGLGEEFAGWEDQGAWPSE